MSVLALECSTSSAKAMLHHGARGVLRVAEKRYDSRDITALDMEAVWRDVSAVVREAVPGGEKAEALALCAIWHSFLPEDGEGRPLSLLSTWADTRGAGEAEAARREARGEELYRATGCPPHSMYPYYQLLAWNRARPRPERVEDMSAWLFRRLTGVSAVSRNTASGSGLMGLDGDWLPRALEDCGLTPARLPRLMEPEESLPLCPEAAEALGLEPGIPVFPGGGDGGLTQIGSGAPVTLSVGTSGAIRMETGEPFFTRPPQTWCYRLWKGRYVAGAATSGGGNCVEWLGGILGAADTDWNEALSCDREKAPLFFPFLWGERSPGFRDNRRGAFLGLTGATDKRQLLYSVLEGVLFHLYDCALRLPLPEGELLLTGGITRNPGWRQLACDLFGRPMTFLPGEHTSLLGAAAVAHDGLGRRFSLPSRGVLTPSSPLLLKKRFKTYRENAGNLPD